MEVLKLLTHTVSGIIITQQVIIEMKNENEYAFKMPPNAPLLEPGWTLGDIPPEVNLKIEYMDGKKPIIIVIDEIHSITSYKNYITVLRTGKPRIVFRCTMQSILALLPDELFYLADRSLIVARQHIESITNGTSGFVIYKDKTRHKIGKRRKTKCEEWFYKKDDQSELHK